MANEKGLQNKRQSVR